MQLKQVARDALLKPLQAVSGIVERRHTLPILSNVLLEQKDGRLLRHRHRPRDADHRAQRTSPGKDGQSTTVGARKLQDLLRALPDDAALNVDADGQQDDGARRALALQPADAAGRPTIRASASAHEQLQTLSLPQKDLRGAAAARPVRDGAAGHPLLPERHAARRRQGRRCRRSPPTATGCRGRASRSPATTARQEVILPRKTVLELAKLLADTDDPVTHRHPRQPGALPLRQRRARLEGRRRQVPRLQPRDPDRPHEAASSSSAPSCCAALQRAAILSNEKIPRRAPGARRRTR